MNLATYETRTDHPLYADYHDGTSWIVGALFAHDDLILSLHDAIHTWMPEAAQPVHAVFGGIPSCAWHAGRVAPKDVSPAHLDKMLGLFEEYNRRNIAVRMTWTYWDIPAAALGDKAGNALLEQAVEAGRRHGVQNGIVVTDDRLADYVRRRYPELTQTMSSIRAVRDNPQWEDTSDYYNAMARRFDYVVVRPSRNFHDDFLLALAPKDRMEILVNNICRMWCQQEDHHMGLQKAVELAQVSPEAAHRIHTHEDLCLHEIKRNPRNTVTCSARDIRRLKALGFPNFKLAGRECAVNRMAWFLSMYLFEPGGSSIPLMPLFSQVVPGLGIQEDSHAF